MPGEMTYIDLDQFGRAVQGELCHLITTYPLTIHEKPQARWTARFRTAAEAIRFAVEELPAYPALDTWMNVGDERFDDNAIHRLYDSGEYPLPRCSRRPEIRTR
jgi:hypothetical protein